MMRMFKDSLAVAHTSPQGFPMETASMTQTSFGPALGLVVAAGASLVLWFGLAQAARWAAHAFF